MIAWIVRHRVLVLALAACVMASCVALALRLRLVTDLSALLPSDSAAVVATEKVRDRLGASVPLQIAIQSPDRAANLRFAEVLSEALSRQIDAHVAYHVNAERRFFERNWWLYLELADLKLVRDRLERELQWRKNPLLVDLESESDEQGPLEELAQRIEARARRIDRFPEGTFTSEDGTLAVVVLWPSAASADALSPDALLQRVEQIVAAEQPAQFHPALEVGYAGGLYDAVRERRALESDLLWASIACLVLVSLAVALFFGRLRAVPLMAMPALFGVAVALAVASLAFGQLNATTAFLGPIILGNGINGAIIQLARYEEERRRGELLDAALVRSVVTTVRATGIAAFAAAIAYGSLMVTQFRGFSQFGLIGAIGIVVSWAATIVVLPALVAVVDRRRVVHPGRGGVAFGVPFARAAVRAPYVVVGAAAVVTLASFAVFVSYVRDPFEYDLRRLGSIRAEADRELATRTGEIFGTFTPTVVLADRAEQVSEVAQVLRARGEATPGVIDDVVTLDTLLPGTPEVQRDKLALLAEIRQIFADAADVPLDADEEAELARWRPPEDLSVVTVESLPPTLLRPFRGADGALAPLVLVYRDAAISYWDGRDLGRLASLVHRIDLTDGTDLHAGGTAVVFAGMLDAIVRDGPIATALSLVGVALLALVMVRGVGGVVSVIGALLLGVLWMIGGAAAAGVRVNFLNFIALPLTFGIGIDYAVNVYLRHRLDGPGRMEDTLRATGGAVALCSLTTTIGYASLLVADSHGLRTFGALAILGELACMVAALLVMPAWTVLLERRQARSAASPAWPWSAAEAINGDGRPDRA